VARSEPGRFGGFHDFFGGGIKALEPPYTVRISGAAPPPEVVRDCVKTAKWALGEGRKDYQQQEGGDVEVVIEIEP
jgi:hypothetical protein